MKKTILMLLVAGAFAVATTYAQDAPKQDKQKTETEDAKTKVKPKTTVRDKAHNVIHPKNKRSSGTKAKHKTEQGKVKTETGEGTKEKQKQ
jgi:Ni/Co efflux regulator RcnB